jgi:hypothetical protein
VTPRLIRFRELTDDEYFCTEEGARRGVTFVNTSRSEPLVCLRYFGPGVGSPGVGSLGVGSPGVGSPGVGSPALDATRTPTTH